LEMNDPKLQLIKRIKRIKQINANPHIKEAELEMCKRFPTHFINQWCLTFDPRTMPKHFPFELYKFQGGLISWIEQCYNNKTNGLIEKSRDVGATWCVVAWSVHKWLFEPGFHCLFGSRKEKLVDDKTINSIFGKIRYIIYHLPTFLRPSIKPETNTDAYMRVINPLNDNQIVGESANINFGRGGRSTICFLDEFAHVEHSEVIWAAISENSDCIIPLSTPNGKGNEFARLRHETPIKVKSIHWKEHPNKDDKWYNKKKLELKDWQIAQELDLSYERSQKGRVYQRFDRKYHVPKEPIYMCPEYEQFVTWDFGIADPTAILWGQVTTEGIIEIFECFELTGWDIDFFAPISKGFRPKEFRLLTDEDQKLIDKLFVKIPMGHTADHYGDHHGTARTANSKRSCKTKLREGHNIKLKTSGKQFHDYRIECVDALLKLRRNEKRNEWYSVLQISPDCLRLIDCMNNYRWDSDDPNDDKIKPKHDWSSHMVTALEFLAINRFPIKKKLHHWELKVR